MTNGLIVQRFRLRLDDDLVLSASPGSAGLHRSLDHVPGASLLGAVAARFEGEPLSPEERFIVFHSGKVRFGNGLPTCDGVHATLPMPLSLHERKGEPAVVDGRMHADKVFNCAHSGGDAAAREGAAQPKQLRGDYLSPDGRVMHPATSYRLKTAIDPMTGRVASGQLFGYESLRSGQSFVCELGFDADVAVSLRERVIVAMQGRLLIGRSRSAQFGRVWCEAVGEPFEPSLPVSGPVSELNLILCADLAPMSDGVPVLSPAPEMLGLPAGRLVSERSFIRTRSYAPYNAHRRLPDLERQVLCAGSVLRFVFDQPVEVGALVGRLRAGLGAHRESGLGQVMCEPAWLAGAQPRFEPVVAEASQVVLSQAPDHPLVHWLYERTQRRAQEDEIGQWVDGRVRELALLQEAARRLHGLQDFESAGPGRSQWGVVAAAAEASRTDAESLLKALFGRSTDKQAGERAAGEDREHGVCHGLEDWDRNTGRMVREDEKSRPATFRDWLRTSVEDELKKSAFANNPGLAVARLAGAAQKMLTQGGWKMHTEKNR